MLKQAWATTELIDQLAVMRQAFGYAGLARSTPPLATGMQPTASTSCQPDGLLPKQPAPKTVQYQPPSFKLTRPTTCLMMNERIQVHHNYISAVSSLEHKKDLINRLKRSDTHNISAYEAEMSCHMTLHEDVLDKILNILKQDDYYRTLEYLPVIDDLTAYDDIRLFPELYDTSTILERITGKADLIKRQLRRPGMYPLPTNPSPSTSTSAPRPTSTFEPISPQQLTENQNTESSPQSSLPCGQRTPAGSTSTSDTPPQHTPPQPFVHSQPQPRNPTPMHHTSPKPHKPQDIQHSPVKTKVNLPTQPPISDEEQQRVPKLTNGSQVKCCKPQLRQQDECLCFYYNHPGHLKRNCPKIPYCSKCRTRGHTPADAPANHSKMGTHVKLESPGINGEGTKNQQEKPVNVSVTLHGPVSKEQLYKIQEVLRHLSQYRDRIKPEDCPVKGEYANTFNKFRSKKVEVNEATVEEAIKYGHFLKRSKGNIAEAIDIYKTLGNETFYSPEEDPADQQEQPEQ